MNNLVIDPFETMIRDAGEGWLIDWHTPREQAIPNLLEKLRLANEVARERLGGNAPSLTPEALVASYAKNPHKVRAFLQVIGSISSADFLLLVWRILQGMEIASIRMEYDATASFHLYVSLASPYSDGAAEAYESDAIEDSVILRHLGTLKMGNQGVFNGFYALSLTGK